MVREAMLSEQFVQDAIVAHLRHVGWSHNLVTKEGRAHGVDIRVRNDRYPRFFLIEVKGDPGPKVKRPASSRESCFNGALGQVLTRMKVKTGDPQYKYGYKYGIGFPFSFEPLVLRRLPWAVCHRLNLYVFLVDADGSVRMFDWREIKRLQLARAA
jgi:hypothetical protein